MIEVVIGDIHARQEKLERLLTQIGVLADGKRQPGYRLRQLGDAVSLGYGEQEAEFLTWFYGLLEDDDVLLLGNHELPAIWQNRGMDFAGYEDHDVVALQMVRDAFREGRYRVATHVNGWLCTHAGLDPSYGVYYRPELPLDQIVEKLDTAFWQAYRDGERMQHSHVITGVGEYGGGIYWLRWNGLCAHYPPTPQDSRIPQIVGHTPRGPELHKSGQLWLLDTKPEKSWRESMSQGRRPTRSQWGGVSALVFQPGQDTPELHSIE